MPRVEQLGEAQGLWACPVLTDIRDQGTWGLREDVQHHGERGEEAVAASAVVQGAVQGRLRCISFVTLVACRR